jgi:hypothetical protein
MNKKLNKIPSAGTKADSEPKDEDMQVSPAIAKLNVVCSQSPPMDKKLTVDVTESRVWVQIGNVGVGFEKENFVKLIEQSKSYKYALSLRE